MSDESGITASDESIVAFWSDKKYKTLNPNLGSGAFGRTVLVEDMDIGLRQAIKIYSPKNMDSDQQARFYKFFKEEIKILHRLNHPNVVRFFAAHLYEKRQSGLIMMEYIEGKSIDVYFKDFNPYADDCNLVFKQLIEAFAYIEGMGVLHRDIRPSNIMIDNQGTVKIIDFGLCKDVVLKKRPENSIQSVVNLDGISQYPDEYQEGEYTSLTDMYYLGEMLKRLMSREEIQEVFFYQPIVEKMAQISPIGRYRSFSEILKEMETGSYVRTEISDEEKRVYQEFVGALCSTVASRSTNSTICRMDDTAVRKIEEILKDNAFEDVIQNNSSLINIFIHGEYKYYGTSAIATDCVRCFCSLYRLSPQNKRELMVRNLNTRMSRIAINHDVDEGIPF